MFTLLTIFGGVALILFGVRFLRKGLDRLFGARMAIWLQDLGRKPVKAFFSGIALAVFTPSSTTISILAVNAIKAGYLTGRQMLVVLHGTDIGLTVMVILLSLRIDAYAPIMLLVGVILFQFTKSEKKRGIGQIVLSLSFVLLGVGIAKTAVMGVKDNQEIISLVGIVQHHPFLLALLAMGLTIMFQSSTAAIALVIAFGHIEGASLALAVPAVVGANVGISMTTLVFGWTQIHARRLALAKLMGKALVALAVLLFMDAVVALLVRVPGHLDAQVAVSHVAFNVASAIFCLSVDRWLYQFVVSMVPEPPQTQQTMFAARHLTGGPIESSALALGLSHKEILHVGEIVRQMFSDVWLALKTNDGDLARAVAQADDKVDLLDSEIKRFLTRVLTLETDGHDSREQMKQLRYLNELENIGDIIDKNLSELAEKKAKLKLEFSNEDWSELELVYTKVSHSLLVADTAFTTRDKTLAQSLLDLKDQIGALDEQLRDKHFQRLKEGSSGQFQASSIHLDILTNLRRINSHVSHIAFAILKD